LLDYSENRLLRTGELDVDAEGAMKGTLRFEMTGQEVLYWRQIALRSDESEARKEFKQRLDRLVPEGVEASIDRFQGLDNPDVNLVAIVKTCGTLGAATSKRLMIPGFFFETRGTHPFVDQDKRIEPVDMHYPSQTIDQIAYLLSAGLTVECAPQDVTIPWPDHAMFITRSVSSPGQVIVALKLVSAFTFAKLKEYHDLRGFYLKVTAADQASLVLARVQTEKGNP
jgi:hypothetical protein